jgi:hypothetical protein
MKDETTRKNNQQNDPRNGEKPKIPVAHLCSPAAERQPRGGSSSPSPRLPENAGDRNFCSCAPATLLSDARQREAPLMVSRPLDRKDREREMEGGLAAFGCFGGRRGERRWGCSFIRIGAAPTVGRRWAAREAAAVRAGRFGRLGSTLREGFGGI